MWTTILSLSSYNYVEITEMNNTILLAAHNLDSIWNASLSTTCGSLGKTDMMIWNSTCWTSLSLKVPGNIEFKMWPSFGQFILFQTSNSDLLLWNLGESWKNITSNI